MIEEAKSQFKKSMGNCAPKVNEFARSLTQKYGAAVPDQDLLSLIERERAQFEEQARAEKVKLTETAIQNLDLLQDSLKEAAAERHEAGAVPAEVQVGTGQIINQLNNRQSKALFIFQAHDPDELREFAATLAGAAYESRRRSGQATPLVSFIFDEADEFIPGQAGSESQKMTKAAAMALARRGRKFGLGLGIATQRIRYLDTSILAQPHTYFVSKLPRQTDRQAIAEAFGLSEDMFRQTFKFRKGDWLLASYDAAGLEALPIPIHAENAEDQILAFINRQYAS